MAFEFCIWEKSELYECILQMDLNAYKMLLEIREQL